MMGNFGYGMMSGFGGSMGLFFGLTWLVWFVVGVLLIIWLWKQIGGK